MIVSVCTSRDLKCELIRGYGKESRHQPILRDRRFTPAGFSFPARAVEQLK